jgi:hypothetical protein
MEFPIYNVRTYDMDAVPFEIEASQPDRPNQLRMKTNLSYLGIYYNIT